jgi:ribosomal protein L22
MADETQAGDPTSQDEPANAEAATTKPAASADEGTTVSTDETPTATADETPAATAEETPAATAEETPAVSTEETPAATAPEAPAPAAAAAPSDADEAPATPAEPAAKTKQPTAAATAKAKTAEAAKAKKPASAKAPAAEQAKPARAGLRGRVKTRGRARKGGETPAELPVVRAQAKYVRTSARKARLVCDHIRGKSVAEAQAILAFAPRAVAQDWAKLLKSAVANAENNHELLGEDLRVKEAFADEGPTLKRFRPRAMGRATPIRKRTSHLTITLTPKE